MKLRYNISVSLNESEAQLLEQIPSYIKPKEIFLTGVGHLIKALQEPRQDDLQDTISTDNVQTLDPSHVSQEIRLKDNLGQVSHDVSQVKHNS